MSAPVAGSAGTSWAEPSAAPRASAQAVDIWRARIDPAQHQREEPALGGLLCPLERARAQRILRPRARAHWVCSRGLLRTLLARYVACDPRELRFELGPHGKPALAQRTSSDLRFNLSHSRGIVLIAVTSGREVGVDVEVTSEPRRTVELLREWTAREAAVKCTGTGLGALGRPGEEPVDRMAVRTASLDLGPCAAAAIAVEGDELPELRLWALAPDPG